MNTIRKMNMFRYMIFANFLCTTMGALYAQEKKMFTYNYDIHNFNLVIDGLKQTCVASSSIDMFYLSDTLQPMIPYQKVNILMDITEDIDTLFFACDNDMIVAENVMLATNPPSVRVGEVPPPIKEAVYEPIQYPTNSNRCRIMSMGLMDGHKVLTFMISPFQYNAKSKKLVLSQQINVTVSTKVSKAKTQNEDTKNTMRDIIPSMGPNKTSSMQTKIVSGASSWKNFTDGYLIISPQSLQAGLDELIAWKRKKGLDVRSISLESIYQRYSGKTDYIKIKRCIQDYYKNYGFKYVLLVGSGNYLPTVNCGFTKIPTDWFYACLDESEDFSFDWNADGDDIIGNPKNNTDKLDLYPEVIVSRIPVESVVETKNFVSKLLNYERNPPSDESWYKKILFAGVSICHSDGEPTDTEITSKIYLNKNISPYFNSNSDFYIGKKYNNSIKKENIQKKFQNGHHIIHMMTHGGFDRFGLSDSITPLNTDTIQGLYMSSDAALMTSSKPSIFIALSCKTNAFDKSNNIGRNFVINRQNGVVAYIGTSRDSWISWDYSWDYDGNWGISGVRDIAKAHSILFENIFNKPTTNGLGAIFSLAKSQMGFSVLEENFYGLNMCGDPEFELFLTRPMQFANPSIVKENGTFLIDIGISGCTFVVRYKNAAGNSIQKCKQNTNFIELTESEFVGCEITLLHKNYIPKTFSPTVSYIQNETITTNRMIQGDVIVAGRSVTTQKPIGDVIIKSGKTTISTNNGVTLDSGFEVRAGSEFEVTIK